MQPTSCLCHKTHKSDAEGKPDRQTLLYRACHNPLDTSHGGYHAVLCVWHRFLQMQMMPPPHPLYLELQLELHLLGEGTPSILRLLPHRLFVDDHRYGERERYPSSIHVHRRCCLDLGHACERQQEPRQVKESRLAATPAPRLKIPP
uniref:HDC02016 n=1 Tax=Drosophila melanogaster TaxID=7227 RepID=Q6IHP4_DROME|nr:TPA_inf: HDC02016 [Drosophila melanogaster]